MTAQQFFKGTLIVLMTLIGAYVLLISMRILIVLLIAIIIASAIRPVVSWLAERRVPKGAAIFLVYLGLALTLIIVALAVIPPIINQIAHYIENDWQLASQIIKAQRWVEIWIQRVTDAEVTFVAPEDIRAAVSDLVAQVRLVVPSMLNEISGMLGEVILIIVMGAYWLTSHEKAITFLTQVSPARYREKTQRIIDEIELSMGNYVRGIATISSIIMVLNFVPMYLLGVPNAITLAFIIGTLTAIPMIGGLIGGVIAVLLTLVSAIEYVPAVLVVFIITQQIENYVLSPRIMSNRVGIEPLLVIVYTAIGFVLAGIIGALIAVPVMGTLHILLQHLVIEPHKENIQAESGFIILKPGVPIEESPAGQKA